MPLFGTVHATINWGDGTSLTNVNSAGDIAHTYATAGTYVINITGTVTHFGDDNGNANLCIVTGVTSWGSLGLTNLSSAFENATNLTSAPSTLPSTVTNLDGVFEGAEEFDGDLSGWVTTNVTTMDSMFYGDYAFDSDISSWNTSHVTDMAQMFADDFAFNQDISGWSLADVTTTQDMFEIAQSFNQDIAGWNLSHDTDLSGMFDGASSFNQNLSGLNTSHATDMSEMFEYALSFDNGGVALTQSTGGWNTSTVTNMASMFYGASAFNVSVSNWSTSNVVNLNSLFDSAAAFDQPLGTWDVTSGDAFDDMLDNTALTIDNFDSTLEAWAAESVHHGETLGAAGLTYGAAAHSAYVTLTTTDGWTIFGSTAAPVPHPPTTTTSTTTTTTTTTSTTTTTMPPKKSTKGSSSSGTKKTGSKNPTTGGGAGTTSNPSSPSGTTTTTQPSGSSSSSSSATTSTTLGSSATTTTTMPSSSGSASTPNGPPTTPPGFSLGSAPLMPTPSSGNVFSNSDDTQLVAQFVVVNGVLELQIDGVDLDIGSFLSAFIHSTPQSLVDTKVGSNGRYQTSVALPSHLARGDHYVEITGMVNGVKVTLVGAFVLGKKSLVSDVVQPAPVTHFTGLHDSQLQRALRFAKPIYDPSAHPHATAGLAVAGVSFLALAGTGGIAGSQLAGGPSPAIDDERRRRAASSSSSKHHSKVASGVTKKLKVIGVDVVAWGDQSATWQTPITHHVDRHSREIPNKFGRFSALAPRISVDGAWLRAAFGAHALVTWILGLVLGVWACVDHSGAPFVPSTIVLFIIVGLAVLDAAAGAVSWIVIAFWSLVTGQIRDWADIRTVLGLAVLVATIPLLAHAIRPLRRYVAGSTSLIWERTFDYVMMPLMAAFAASAMAKALDGLSGIEILSPANISALRWLIGIMLIVRLLGEDLTVHFYPERTKKVQPEKLRSPSRLVGAGSLAFKFLLYLVVMDPFFGINWRTILAASLLAIPGIMKLWEESWPNSTFLHRWLPRGLTSFFMMLVLGSYLSFRLLGSSPTPSTMEETFIWLLLPGVVIGIIEIFAREGVDWTNVWLKRVLGAGVWVTAALLVTGNLVLFK